MLNSFSELHQYPKKLDSSPAGIADEHAIFQSTPPQKETQPSLLKWSLVFVPLSVTNDNESNEQPRPLRQNEKINTAKTEKRFLVCSHLCLFLVFVLENLDDFRQVKMSPTQR